MEKSQADRLLDLLSDGQPHSTIEIQRVVYGGEHLGTARIASRVTDLRDRGYEIESKPWKINKTVWWYRLKEKPAEVPKQRHIFEPVFDAKGRIISRREIIVSVMTN